MLDGQAARVHRQQREDLGLPPVEQQPLPVEPHLGGAEQRQREAGIGGRRGPERCRTPVRGQRPLDQPRHHARRREADGVGAVPGRREVDDAQRAAGHRVEDRSRPAHPVVHDLGVVLGAEDHRRGAGPSGDGERVGADARLVPATAGHEVHRLGLAAHHPAAVGPEDAGLLVGDRDDEVAVLGRPAQLVLHPRRRRSAGATGSRTRRCRPRRRAVRGSRSARPRRRAASCSGSRGGRCRPPGRRRRRSASRRARLAPCVRAGHHSSTWRLPTGRGQPSPSVTLATGRYGSSSPGPPAPQPTRRKVATMPGWSVTSRRYISKESIRKSELRSAIT